MSETEYKEIKTNIKNIETTFRDILNALAANDLRNRIEEIKRNEEQIINYISQDLVEQNKERNQLNNFIFKYLIPKFLIGAGIILFLYLIFEFILRLLNKQLISVLYPLCIVIIGGVSIVSLVIAVKIVNKKED
jgi:Fe2+ transport system protein B